MKKDLAKTDLSHHAYTAIKEMILSGKLKPGTKLVQEKLAVWLGVSRMPLHKAFQMLENEKLVESFPRRGMYVKKFDIGALVDAFECREALESLAAARTAKLVTKAAVSRMKALFAPFQQNSDQVDPYKYEKADLIFHRTIMNLSGNRFLKEMEVFDNYLKQTYQSNLSRRAAETLDEHMQIIEAFEKKDSEGAARAMRIHLTHSRERLIDWMALNGQNLRLQ